MLPLLTNSVPASTRRRGKKFNRMSTTRHGQKNHLHARLRGGNNKNFIEMNPLLSLGHHRNGILMMIFLAVGIVILLQVTTSMVKSSALEIQLEPIQFDGKDPVLPLLPVQEEGTETSVIELSKKKKKTIETNRTKPLFQKSQCPCGSEIELHKDEARHGDVCRFPDQNFECPWCCASRPVAPYCADEHGAPCRTPCTAGTATDGPSSSTSSSSNNHVVYDLGIVLRTWHEDVELGIIALESLTRVLPHDVYHADIVIITDDGSAQEVRAAVNAAVSDGDFQPVPASKVRVVVEEQFMNGNIQQKYSKLTADLHTNASLILHVDSDMRYHTWDETCFFAVAAPTNTTRSKKDGGHHHLPVLDYAPWSILPKNVLQWKEGSEHLLGIQDVQFEFSRSNQHIYPRELYRELRTRVETIMGKDFKSVFTDTPLVGTDKDLRKHQEEYGAGSTAILVSDFNLLGVMAYYHMPRGIIHFRNNLEESGTANCQSQCNSRMFSTLCCKTWFNTLDSYQEKHQGSLCGYDCRKEFMEPFATTSCIHNLQIGSRSVSSCTALALTSS